MKLMKDVASLMNYLMVNDTLSVKVGDSFARLYWTDRTLFKVTRIEGKTIYAKRVSTVMKDGWQDGYGYPQTDANGEWVLQGHEVAVTKPRKYWKMDGQTVHLSWGATTDYRDPTF